MSHVLGGQDSPDALGTRAKGQLVRLTQHMFTYTSTICTQTQSWGDRHCLIDTEESKAEPPRYHGEHGMIRAIGGASHHLYSEHFLRQVFKLVRGCYRGLRVGGCPIVRRPALGSSRQPGDLRFMVDLSGRVLT